MANESKLILKNILFLDIETVSSVEKFEQLSPRMQDLWTKKSQKLKNEAELNAADMFFERAAIYAEFGKIIAIGVGGVYLHNETNETCLKVKSLFADSEKELLNIFAQLIHNHSAKDNLILCAHNGREFDFPYLCRRLLINGIKLPDVLNISAKKPWEVLHIDTLEFWKFGDYKNYTSLDLLSAVFDIPSSKSDIDGSQVNKTFYKDNDLEKIARYCKEDVVVLVQLYLKLNGREIIKEENILRG